MSDPTASEDQKEEDVLRCNVENMSPSGIFRNADGENETMEDVEDHGHHSHLPWYKNPYQRMAMLSNFSTSYNVVNISLVLPILQALVDTSDDKVSAGDTSIVASSLLGGMILGQIVGGALGDSFLGLAGALRLVMFIQIVASLGSAFVIVDARGENDFDGKNVTLAELSDKQADKVQNSLYWQLSLWRFALGLGCGAVYPLAACLSVEQAGSGTDQRRRKETVALRRVVRTFSMQGFGFWFVPAVTLPLLYTSLSLDLVWRIVLGLGALPGLVLAYLQWRLYYSRDSRVRGNDVIRVATEEPRSREEETFDDEHNPDMREKNEHIAAAELREDSDGEVGTFLDSSPDLSSGGCLVESDPPYVRQGWRASMLGEDDLFQKLMATAATWFLFDVLFYGNTLFQPIVVETAFGPKEATNPRGLLQRTALDSLLLASIALPGYAVAGFAIGRRQCGFYQSPRHVMIQGFAFMSILYLAIGTWWYELRRFPMLLVFLYGFTFFFANYGPNTTTFILPSLVYSAECRSTLNGLSAAAGKLGAYTGATLFAPAADAFGDAKVMLVCAMIGFVALWITLGFVPSQSETPSSPRTNAPEARAENPSNHGQDLES